MSGPFRFSASGVAQQFGCLTAAGLHQRDGPRHAALHGHTPREKILKLTATTVGRRQDRRNKILGYSSVRNVGSHAFWQGTIAKHASWMRKIALNALREAPLLGRRRHEIG